MRIRFQLSFVLFLLFAVGNADQVAAQNDSSAIELNIFPNPSRGTFYVTVINEASYWSELYSMDGRLIKSKHLQSGLNYYTVEEPAGMYILRVGKGVLRKEFKILIR